MFDFTHVAMHSRMNLVPSCRSHRDWRKILKNQKVAGKCKSTLSVVYGLKYKLRFTRETPKRAFSSHFSSLLTAKPNSSQLRAFSISALVSLTLSVHALSLNFRKKASTFAVLACFAAAN